MIAQPYGPAVAALINSSYYGTPAINELKFTLYNYVSIYFFNFSYIFLTISF